MSQANLLTSKENISWKTKKSFVVISQSIGRKYLISWFSVKCRWNVMVLISTGPEFPYWCSFSCNTCLDQHLLHQKKNLSHLAHCNGFFSSRNKQKKDKHMKIYPIKNRLSCQFTRPLSTFDFTYPDVSYDSCIFSPYVSCILLPFEMIHEGSQNSADALV